jgi:hypothetical protein
LPRGNPSVPDIDDLFLAVYPIALANAARFQIFLIPFWVAERGSISAVFWVLCAYVSICFLLSPFNITPA